MVLVAIIKQKAQLSLGWADHITQIRRPASDFQLREENDSIFHSDCSLVHAMVTLLYRTLQLSQDTIRLFNVPIDDGCGQQLCI